ncbi:Cloroperoxidase [Mycena rebaudengoi]|nr:Cloroperoxidase [Mycena rebaudengoi]KAJ7216803.1 Cloroperoxidase [Mycena rebaudengoi]
MAVLSAGGISAFPDLQEKHQWVAPKSIDSRSPCPGLISPTTATSRTTAAIRPDALSLQNLVEHDASISRNDFALGDNVKFNDAVYATLANSNPGKSYYEPVSSVKNPDVVNTKKEFQLRTRETGLYLSIFDSGLSRYAPKKFVNIFFREERLPIAEGWKKSETLINTAGLEPLEQIIEDASGWTKTQSCEPLILGPSTTL